MSLTRDDLVDAVQLRAFAGQNLLETNIQTELNAVVTAISRGIYTDERGARKVHYWNDLKAETDTSLAIDAWYIDLTNNRAVQKVRLADSDSYYTTLTERSIERADIATPYPATTAGRPALYSMWGDRMIFDVKAVAAYTVWTRRYLWPTDMSAGTSTPTITNIDDVIIARVTGNIMAMRQGQDAAEAVYWINEGQRLYIEAIMADANKQAVDGPIQFRPGGK
jgi:hypothetical protein